MLQNISSYKFYKKLIYITCALIIFYNPTTSAIEYSTSCIDTQRLNENIDALKEKVEKLKRNEAHHSMHRKIAEKRLKKLEEELVLAKGQPDCADLSKRVNELEQKLRKDINSP